MIEFIPATDDDMYDVLDVRNATREFMTHHTDYITTSEQEQWWTLRELNGYKVWLVVYRDDDPADCNGYLAGFCMLRQLYDSGRVYATLALYPQFRGHGIGTKVYQFLVSHHPETWIDVRNDNIASINAALKAGFTMHYIGAEISELVYRNGS